MTHCSKDEEAEVRISCALQLMKTQSKICLRAASMTCAAGVDCSAGVLLTPCTTAATRIKAELNAGLTVPYLPLPAAACT